MLAGEDMPLDSVLKWAESAEVVIAADGGANRLLECGVSPAQTIGDFDSATPEAMRAGGMLVRDARQDRTDCDKLLSLAAAGGYTEITLVSAEGDLPDHEIGTIHSAGRSPLLVRIAYRRGIAWMVRPGPSIEVAVSVGARIAMLPISTCQGASLQGVRWSFEGVALEPEGFTSISNLATEATVRARIGAGVAWLFAEYAEEEMPFW